jgi:hypothetical protein
MTLQYKRVYTYIVGFVFASKQEEKLTSGLLFFLFRKLLVINVIFALNVHIVVYLSVDGIVGI